MYTQLIESAAFPTQTCNQLDGEVQKGSPFSCVYNLVPSSFEVVFAHLLSLRITITRFIIYDLMVNE